MKHLSRVLLILLALGPASAALADTVGAWDGATGVFPNFKTPPLQTSQTTVVPLAIHFSQSRTNWAGAFFRVHVLDATEVDMNAVKTSGPNIGPATFASPFGTASNNLASSPVSFTAWHTQATASGVAIATSGVQHFGSLIVHAKNTTPANNSDIDITAAVWNIFHLVPGPGSTTLTIQPSDYVYGTSNATVSEIVFPAPTPEPGAGHWIHWDGGPQGTQVKTFHVPSGFGSFFWATLAGTAQIGLEHVPEPTTGLLLGGGFLALGANRWLRRRRIRLS